MLKDVIKELCSNLKIERIELTANVNSDVLVIYVAKDKVEAYSKPLFRKIDETKKREGILKSASSRVKDERIKAVMEANPGLTFKDWCQREYPQKNYNRICSMLHSHPELAMRNAIEKVKDD
jgi:ERCC4-related helicase